MPLLLLVIMLKLQKLLVVKLFIGRNAVIEFIEITVRQGLFIDAMLTENLSEYIC